MGRPKKKDVTMIRPTLTIRDMFSRNSKPHTPKCSLLKPNCDVTVLSSDDNDQDEQVLSLHSLDDPSILNHKRVCPDPTFVAQQVVNLVEDHEQEMVITVEDSRESTQTLKSISNSHENPSILDLLKGKREETQPIPTISTNPPQPTSASHREFERAKQRFYKFLETSEFRDRHDWLCVVTPDVHLTNEYWRKLKQFLEEEGFMVRKRECCPEEAKKHFTYSVGKPYRSDRMYYFVDCKYPPITISLRREVLLDGHDRTSTVVKKIEVTSASRRSRYEFEDARFKRIL